MAQEKVKFKDMPTVTKIGEIPTGVCVLRINQPFRLRHLVKAGVKDAFITSFTSKSISAILKEQKLVVDEFRETMKTKVENLHPSLKKRIHIQIDAQIRLGHREQPAYVKDVAKLYNDILELGLSDLPLIEFGVPLQNPHQQIAVFLKRREAFICTQIGSRMFHQYSRDELESILTHNDVMQKLGAYTCETIEKTGTWLSCKLPQEE